MSLRRCPARRHRLVSLLALIVNLTALVGVAAVGTSAPASATPHTRLVSGNRHGAAAVQELGAHLDVAARRNGMSTTKLRALLETDHTAWVDPAGRLYFKEAPVPASVTSTASAAPQIAAATVPDVFALHSRTGSSRTIYLDFVGRNVSGTVWNADHGLAAQTYSGFSLDSDPTTFSSTERGAIQEIWERVAAAYAPFDVDVTTQPPTSPIAGHGTEVLISSSSTTANAVCGGSCAGIAYIGTFATDSAGYYSPAWVFPSGAGGSITYIAQSVEHEIGHTFGLVHDGIWVNNVFQPYYGGNGLWGPIMGGGTAEAVYQFSKGDYPNSGTQGVQTDPRTGATNNDDLAVIAESAPLLPDDAGNTLATALPLGAATSYSRTGLISTDADVDVFAIDRTCSGTFSLSANPTVQNAPLDIGLTLRDASGAQVASADPQSSTNGDPVEPLASGMGASLSTSLGAGTYYVSVDGVGNTGSRGYSSYGSVGAYQLTATGCAAATSPTTAPPTTTTPTTTTTVATTSGTTTGGGTTTGTTPTTTTSGTTGGTTPAPTGTGGPTAPTEPTPPGTTGDFTPTAPALAVRVDRLHRQIVVSWSDVDAPPAGTTLEGWQLRLVRASGSVAAGTALAPGAESARFTQVPAGRYVVSLRSAYSDGSGATSSRPATMGSPVRSTAPRSVHAHRGARGGSVTVQTTWQPPATSGSFPLTGFQVEVLHVVGGRVVGTRVLSAARTAHRVGVSVSRHGSYRLRVRALTAAGPSAWSATSGSVRGR